MSDTITAAIVGVSRGIVTGRLSALFPPWVQWGIEQKRLKFQKRKDLIAEWRALIKLVNSPTTAMINSHLYLGDILVRNGWLTLKPHLSPLTRQHMESVWASYCYGVAGGIEVKLLTDEVARIEKEWKLV